MTMNVEKHLRKLVQDNNGGAYDLSAQFVQLEVVQGAVSSLIQRLDEIVHNGWDKDHGMAYLSINEIRDTVRLIDMGFNPLTKGIRKSIEEVRETSEELFDLVVSKSVSEATSNTVPQEKESQSV